MYHGAVATFTDVCLVVLAALAFVSRLLTVGADMSVLPTAIVLHVPLSRLPCCIWPCRHPLSLCAVLILTASLLRVTECPCQQSVVLLQL
jgi:hypothetical protein